MESQRRLQRLNQARKNQPTQRKVLLAQKMGRVHLLSLRKLRLRKGPHLISQRQIRSHLPRKSLLRAVQARKSLKSKAKKPKKKTKKSTAKKKK